LHHFRFQSGPHCIGHNSCRLDFLRPGYDQLHSLFVTKVPGKERFHSGLDGFFVSTTHALNIQQSCYGLASRGFKWLDGVNEEALVGDTEHGLGVRLEVKQAVSAGVQRLTKISQVLVREQSTKSAAG
jgi:hypothetical protein